MISSISGYFDFLVLYTGYTGNLVEDIDISQRELKSKFPHTSIISIHDGKKSQLIDPIYSKEDKEICEELLEQEHYTDGILILKVVDSLGDCMKILSYLHNYESHCDGFDFGSIIEIAEFKLLYVASRVLYIVYDCTDKAIEREYTCDRYICRFSCYKIYMVENFQMRYYSFSNK